MANEYATAGGFPSFAPLFERSEGVSVPLYLTLIGSLTQEDAQITIPIVRRCVAESPDATAEVMALFADYNWRPQIVGAVALLTGLVNTKILHALWTAFDSGSWVSPQLAVTASQCDPDFASEARQRIEAGCPINTSRLDGIDWATRHSAAGPISFAMHSSKALASLVTICQIIPDVAPWLEQVIADENISGLLQGYTDGAEHIVTYWYKGIESVFPRVTQ